MLNPHPGCKNLIHTVSDNKISLLLSGFSTEIAALAEELHIDENYLLIQLRLLLPFYEETLILSSSEEITKCIFQDISCKAKRILHDYCAIDSQYRTRNGIENLGNKDYKLVDKNGRMFISGNDSSLPIRFDNVDSTIGLGIQQDLHYIHKCRSDTLFHYGLFLGDSTYPLCYCAVSLCDRQYQKNALQESLGEPIPRVEDIYVITRAFGFAPLPKNMMSKLFDYTARALYEHEYDSCKSSGLRMREYMITALNPFLGFSGGIFLGSSFRVFATSPMRYNYSCEGYYLNRKSRNGAVVSQRYSTPPIVWLVRALSKASVAKVDHIAYYYDICKEEYDEG